MDKNILILGGTQTGTARSLLTYLVPEDGDPLAKHIRVVDKHLCIPQSDVFLTYVDSKSKKALKNPCVEYVQGNLLLPATQEKVFTRPDDDSKPYDYVFDFTGEEDYGAEDVVHIERTVKLAANLGSVATTKGGVKAYVRLLGAEYQSENSSKKPLQEDNTNVSPWTRKQKWGHEAARALAKNDKLNLVIARTATIYGPYMVTQITGRLLIGEIYHYLREKMEMLWNEDVRLHTIHSNDLSRGLWALANWMDKIGSRQKADEVAKSPLPPCRPLPSWVHTYVKGLKDSKVDTDKEIWSDTTKFPAKDETVYAPLFNLVDNSDTTLGTISKVVAEVIGVEWGFVGSLISQFAKLNLDQALEDANDKHLEPWSEMLENSNPPITNPPVNPFIPIELMTNEQCKLDGEKIERIVGWKPTFAPKFDKEHVTEVIQLFRAEGGVWPNAKPRM